MPHRVRRPQRTAPILAGALVGLAGLVAPTATALATPSGVIERLAPDVGPGDSGDEVTAWQERLNEWLRLSGSSLYPIVVDGDFGPQTETATREFQRANAAVGNDGTVEDDDLIALEAAISTLESTGAGEPADEPAAEPADDSTDDAFDVTLTWWQTALNEWLALTDSSLFPIVVDGIYGPQTETATREFQRADDSVDNDGTVDDDDRVAIENAIDTLEATGATPTATTDDETDENDETDSTTAATESFDVVVSWWQARLNEWLRLMSSSLYPIEVDGIFGPQTETATREFQIDDDTVDNDGVVDPIDRVALENAIEALGDGVAAGAGATTTTGSSNDVSADASVDQRVVWWQAGLNEWLFLTDHVLYPIVVDGEFGPQTATATRVFEASTDGLDVDGLVTDADRVALENAIDALGG